MNGLTKIITMVTLLIASVSFSQMACSETGLRSFDGMSKTISMVDKKKKIINLADTEFVYDEKTLIVNYKGKRVSEDALKKGVLVNIRLDTKQRYMSRPVLKSIQIESGD